MLQIPTYQAPCNAPSLGPRLNSLLQLVVDAQQHQRYDTIWDCCCDHGYLGINLLQRKLADKVVFVDQVASIMQQLQPRLRNYPEQTYELLTADAGQLTLASEQRHLIIMAGIGGENIVKMLRGIAHNNPNTNIDILCCPTTTQFHLREYLADRNYSLTREFLVTENNRDYEVIYVQHREHVSHVNPVSNTGQMWNGDQRRHHRYLQKLVTHYRNQSRTDASGKKHTIMQHYQACLDKLGGVI